jgi:hypothetical protein
MLIEDENSFYIVDWDTLIMAPKERDLMVPGDVMDMALKTEGALR